MSYEDEGVIRFNLDFDIGDSPNPSITNSLRAWRQILYRLNLIGQDPKRNGGHGFGNVSRLYEGEIIITGTQTGVLETLDDGHFSRVINWCQGLNFVWSIGMIEPSSDTLLHASVYKESAGTRFVAHVQSPDIWNVSRELKLPVTSPGVHYESPRMPAEIERLFIETTVRRRRVFSIGSREGSVVAFGQTMSGAATRLITTLAEATCSKA